jgi:hypothetical protein
MRVGDLVHLSVVDQHDRAWGRVRDAHLVQDGPVLASGRAAFRLHGLVAGRSTLGARLGPRWLHRHAVYIPWTAVTRVEDDRILVDAPDGGFAPSVMPAGRPSG